MKNLWTSLPPLLSDNYGLIEVVDHSDGCAVIDDSGAFHSASRRGGPGGPGGGPGGMGRREFSGGRGGFGRPGGGKPFHGGRGGGGRASLSERVTVSSVGEQDVVSGTKDRILDAFDSLRGRCAPQFALFSAGPCGAMIGTDLDEVAALASQRAGIPAAAVDLTGQKTYDAGMAKTAQAMVQLLAEPGTVRAGTVNLLGANALDWAAEDVAAVKEWIEDQGFQVLTCFGAQTAREQLTQMGRAQANLALTVSGVAAARELQSRFGTPFAALSPFGEAGLEQITRFLEGGSAPLEGERPQAEALIVGEQLAANAVRRTLERKGIVQSADVATFYQMDKAFARPGDFKLKGNDHAREALNGGKYRLIAADGLLRPLLKRECRWIDLPHRVFDLYNDEAKGVPMLGSRLDEWLEKQL